MKRQISILACLLMLVAIVFAVASCTRPDAAHVHNYVETEVKEATCTEKGAITYTCSCGDTYTDETSAKGHDIQTLAAKAPTCTESGLEEGEGCKNCGMVTKAQAVVAALGHELGAPATCTTAQTCARGCGKTFVEALGHKEVAATCTEAAYCSVCTVELAPANGHNPSEATCTEPSVCTVCKEEQGPALGHELEYACLSGFCYRCEMVYLEATAEHTYNYECDIACTTCNEFTNMSATHDMIYVEAKASTCTEHGNTEYWYCGYCDIVWDTHNPNTPNSNRKNHELELAEHEYFYACDAHCMNCHQLTNEEAAHDTVDVPAKAPTCTEMGNTAFTMCNLCGGMWDAEGVMTNRFNVIIPANGHKYRYECDTHCMTCGELTNEDAEHSLDHVDAKAPTCTEDGNVEYYECEFCGECWDVDDEVLDTVVVPALGHTYAVECDPVCLVCYDINEDAGHDVVHAEAKKNTCTEDGNLEHWYCSYCDMCWVNEGLTVNTNKKNVVLHAPGHKGHDYDRKCDNCNIYILPEEGQAFKLSMYQPNKKSTYYFTGLMSGYYYATTNQFSGHTARDMFIEETNGGFYIYFMSGTTKNYLYVQVSGSHINPKYGSTNSCKGLWTFDQTTGAFITKTGGKTVYLGTYSNYVTISASETWRITGNNASAVDKTQFIARPMIIPHTPGAEATCTAHSICTVCSTVVTPMHGHNYVDGACADCGKEQTDALVNATVNLSDMANRTEFSTTKQVYSQNGVTVTNCKGNSTSNVSNYAPIRCYQGAYLTIEGSGITKIVFTAQNTTYGTYLARNLRAMAAFYPGITVTASNSVITITFSEAVDSFTITCFDTAVYIKDLTVNP